MNKEQVIAWAREAFIKRGFWPNEIMWECWKDAWIAGAAAEREACAKVCDAEAERKEADGTWLWEARRCAAAIRARRNTQ